MINNLFRKGLVCVILVLFVGISVVPMAGSSLSMEKHISTASPYNVDLSCDDPYQDVKQGDTTLFIVEITNTGTLDDTYDVTAGSIEDIVCKVNGVNADQFDPYPISLQAGESTTFDVTAEVWESVPEGEWSITVEAHSQNNTDVYDELILTANVQEQSIPTSSSQQSSQQLSSGSSSRSSKSVVPSTGTNEDKKSTLCYTFAFTHPTLGMVHADSFGYTTIDMPGCISIGRDVGKPVMPVKPVKLLLPPMTTVTSINVVGIPVELTSIETPIYPYQNPMPIGFEPEEFQFNNALCASGLFYPSNIYDGYNIGYSHGYAILDITLNPVQYIPFSGRVFYYPEMTVTIDLEKTGEVNQFFRNNLDDKSWVERLVYNPEITETYTDDLSVFDYPGGLCDPSDDYDYVIITTTHNSLDYWETSSSITYNWDSLMTKHEEDDGLRCTLVTIQDIIACPDYWNSTALFNDTQAKIREFCKDAYQDWGISYVFIGGDDEWIPARHMKYAYESNVDSDLYWSNLDNNFNADGDGYWGEEGDSGFDLYSELFIGRITCDVPQDVSNWMTKSFYYVDATDPDYLENAAFYGGDAGWPPCGSDDIIDFAAIKGTDSWLGFLFGFETWNALHPGNDYNLSVKWTGDSSPNPGWQGGSQSSAITGFRNAINNDHVTLISGIAHANAKMSLDIGMNSWESDYHNTKPFFIFDLGSHCGDMDAADDGVLHSMLFHSDTELAFACVYNTCYGWGSCDLTNSSSAIQMKLFWDYMFDLENNSVSPMNWQLGIAMAYSKDTMAPTINWDLSYGSWRGIIQGCLLFGDPAQRIKAPSSPPCYPVLDGTMGENGWYVSDVYIIFEGSGCESVYYKIDDGGWATYVAPIVISEDGVHLFCWFYVDNEGNPSDVECIEIKIDQTDPTIDLTIEKIGFRKWLFTAIVIDETSGVNRVEFYYADELLGEVTEAPYEWIWSGKGGENVTAIVYDNAGNSAQEEKPVSHSYSQSQSSSSDQSIINVLPSSGTKIVEKSSMPTFYGNILYVGGSGPNNYTSIQDAIDAASNGDTIFVYSGTYHEGLIIDKSINLLGENKTTTIIDGDYDPNPNCTAIILEADYVTISGFTITEGYMAIVDTGIRIYEHSHITISDNIIDSKKLYIGINVGDSSNYNIIARNIFTGGRLGIYIADKSNNNQIIGNTLTDHYYWNGGKAIWLYDSHNNTVSNNYIARGEWGLILSWSSSNNTISMNNITDIKYSGIYLSDADNNVITRNTLANSRDGIWLVWSSDCHIYENNMINNSRGAYLNVNSNNNVFYHNNFNNTRNAYDECNNTWDDGYPSGGNYWDDYTGVDADGDGIGDTPYNISGGSNQDLYPLMLPLDDIPPVITDVTATPYVQSTTEPVNVTCTVTDNWDLVDTVKINITGPEGFALEAIMNEGSYYYYEDTYTTIGVYHYFIWANDTSDNIAISDTHSFVIVEIPWGSIVDPLPTWITAVPFTVTATAFGCTGVANITLWYRYSSDGTEWTDWTSYGTDEEEPWSWSFTGSDGYYEFYSIAVDVYGNVEDLPSTADVATGIDTVPPVTTIDFGEPYYKDSEGNIYVTSDTPIYLNAIDNESGVNVTYYKINDGNWEEYVAPFSILEDCNHAIYFYSDDNAGNVESIKNKNVSVDNYPPYPVIPLPDGKNGWYNSSVIIIFTDAEEKSGIFCVWYRVDFGHWMVYYEPIIITGDGYHTVHYYAVDNVGNEGTGSFSFKIDQTDPVTTCLLNGTVGENGWYVSDITVTLNAEDETSGVDYTMYKLDDDVEWQTYIESFIVTEDGEHVLYYCSVDIAGNTETTNEVAFKIDHDTEPPVTTHEFDGIMGDNNWYKSNVAVTLTAEDDSAGVACTRYKVDDDIWRNYTTSFIVTEDGMHNLSYYSVDKVGNKEDDKGPFGFKIDQIAPTINLTVEKIGFRKWLLTATVSDETSGVNRVEFYYADELLGEVTEAPYEWLYSGSYGENATAIVYDNAGNYAQDEKPVSHSQSRSSNPQTPLFFQILGRLLNTR